MLSSVSFKKIVSDTCLAPVHGKGVVCVEIDLHEEVVVCAEAMKDGEVWEERLESERFLKTRLGQLTATVLIVAI